MVPFTAWAIQRWRELAGLDENVVGVAVVNTALEAMTR
jgi:hypothetical protein